MRGDHEAKIRTRSAAAFFRPGKPKRKPRGAGQSPASPGLPVFQPVGEENHKLPYYDTPIPNRHTPFFSDFLN
jgi:hypothetical protein